MTTITEIRRLIANGCTQDALCALVARIEAIENRLDALEHDRGLPF